MSDGATPTLESIEARVSQTLARLQEQRSRALDDRDLAWLALVPVWTVPLAGACGWHGGGPALQAFLDGAEALGMVVQQHADETLSPGFAELLERSAEPQFWMPASERARVLADLGDRVGPSFLLSMIGEIAARLPPATSIPALDQWRELASLAADGGIEPAAVRLRAGVRALLERGETGAALGLLRTSSLLAQALGGQLDSAVRRGEREVEIAYRRAHDRRALDGFLERPEQVRAFAELVGPDDSLWALHFLGIGGTGKTMLVRHITADLAGKSDCITARVDFDYISPNYPLLHPEQLLVELADELRTYSAAEEFETFEGRIRTLQDAMGRRAPDVAAGDPLRAPEFRAVQRAFIGWLRRLPRRVVLILDTCEELAKLQAAGEMAPSIRATYQILEELHDAVPSLRVIFAGRRPLALSGHGWRLRAAALPEGRRHLPPAKGYLRLHLIRGFTAGEADQYFARQRLSPPPPPALRDAIFQYSHESTAVLDLLDGASAAGEPRYNPFDLSLYARWLRDNPALSAELIRSGRTDPYVDLRIARRLTDSVRRLLPAVAFLGRFDESMLRPAAPQASDAAFADVYRELAEQEWIEFQQDAGATFLQVDRNLHPRLVAYCTADAEQRRLFDDARRQLAPALRQLVRDRAAALAPRADPGPARQPELGFDLVHGALRALDVEAAADLWEEIETGLAAAGRWDWGAVITARLLGEEGPGAAAAELRPAIMATQASAMLHAERGIAVARAWDNVAAVAAARSGLSGHTQAIEERAWLGRIAASPQPELTPADAARIARLWSELPQRRGAGVHGAEQTVAMLVAATERLVDDLVDGPQDSAVAQAFSVPDAAVLSGDSVSSELRAFTLTLWSRVHRARGDATRSAALAGAAVDVAGAPAAQARQRWAGWRAPDSIADFVQLERLLQARWFAAAEASPLLAAWPAAVDRLHLVDAERLVSVHLELRLGERVVERRDLEMLAARDRYDRLRQPVRAAHRAVAPLVVNVALGWLALGDSERALAGLEMRIQAVKAAGPDPETILEAEQAKLRIISRMRLPRRGESLMERSLAAPELATLGWPARALNGFPPDDLRVVAGQISSQLLHARWRSRVAMDERATKEAIPELIRAFREARSRASPIAATLAADLAEAACLSLHGDAAAFEPPAEMDAAIADLRSRRAVACDELVRLECRAVALRRDRRVPDADLVGRRRFAELALEEGELLALRLPALALPLLDLAHDSFVGVGDRAGALIAAVCAAAAGVRCNSTEHVDWQLTTKVQPAYERLVADGADGAAGALPAWDELERCTHDPRADLQRFDDPCWSGWAHRLFRCLLWVEPADTKVQLLWLARHYGERLPVELGFSPQEIELARRTRRHVRGDDRLLNAGLLALGLLVALGLVLAIGSSYWSPLAAATCTAGALGLWVLTPLYLGVLALALAKGVSAMVMARRRLGISLESGETGAGTDVTAVRPIDLRVQVIAPLLNPRARVALHVSTFSPGLRRYRESAGSQPFELVELLARTRGRLIGNCWWNRMAVPIQAPPAVLESAWEALFTLALPVPAAKGRLRRYLESGGRGLVLAVVLALAVGAFASTWSKGPLAVGASALGFLIVVLAFLGSWRSRGNELHFFRGRALRRDDAQLREAWQTKLLRSECSRKWRLLAEQGWRPLAKRGFGAGETPSLSGAGPEAAGGCAVLYAVGRTLGSEAGLQLEVADDESLLERGRGTAAGGRRYLGADDLRRHEAALVVLQGEPLTEAVERGQSDRESAALLRAFAAELFAAGAEAILVLPSLHAPLAEKALQAIARRIARRRPPQLHRLLDAVAAVRQIIRDWPAPPRIAGSPDGLESFRQDQLESSFDVCLFARDPRIPFPTERPATVMPA
jgi:hypothetical protein